jgi:hypothetical protein
MGVYEPDYDKYVGRGQRNYRRYLRTGFRPLGRESEQRTRAMMFETLGAQQSEANRAGTQALTQGFGLNNPTGLQAEMQRRNALQADYAGANLASREASRRTRLEMGQALQASKQAQANWYSTLVGPYLQQQAMESQLAMMGSQASGQQDAAIIGGIGSLLSSIVPALVLGGL